MIPTYLVVKELGLLDSVWSLIIPGLINTYYVTILRTAMIGVPREMTESAELDGANELAILVRILLPLIIPTIAAIGLFIVVGYWNSWYPALMFMRNRALYPLQMFLREVLITEQETSVAKDVTAQSSEAFDRELVKYCMVIISTVPILVIYPFLQRYFVKGVMIGAIKG